MGSGKEIFPITIGQPVQQLLFVPLRMAQQYTGGSWRQLNDILICFKQMNEMKSLQSD